jgi:hypothetical protein
MSIPPYPEANSFGTLDGQPTGARVPIKYIWPKRIAVILAGLAVVGGIGFGAKTLLQSDNSANTSRETVQSASPAPAPSQAPQSPAPAASQAPTAPMTLAQAVTDSAGALSGEQIAEVQSAVTSLQAARDVRLWVVYVDAFDVPPGEWARKTLSLTKMGERE